MASNLMSSWRPPCHAFTLSKSSRMGSLGTHFTSMRIGVGQSIYGSKPVKTAIVMMGKREQDLQEIREKSNEDINEEIIDLKGDIHMIRILKSTKQEYKASDYDRMRKRVSVGKRCTMPITFIRNAESTATTHPLRLFYCLVFAPYITALGLSKFVLTMLGEPLICIDLVLNKDVGNFYSDENKQRHLHEGPLGTLNLNGAVEHLCIRLDCCNEITKDRITITYI